MSQGQAKKMTKFITTPGSNRLHSWKTEGNYSKYQSTPLAEPKMETAQAITPFFKFPISTKTISFFVIVSLAAFISSTVFVINHNKEKNSPLLTAKTAGTQINF